MEEVHLFAMKHLLDFLRHTSNKMIYGETGRYPSYMIIGMKIQQILVEASQLVWEQSKHTALGDVRCAQGQPPTPVGG